METSQIYQSADYMTEQCDIISKNFVNQSAVVNRVTRISLKVKISC